ncbi:uncharacterized protein EI97DRAFT_392719 [Westerdykella ornata]|uniref:Hsp90 chaperone protein kinase-targeting subunit n=1 Tax=Westerdykella ornata TaxID=318751 RepID=A0A6A6JTR0_WESOR|nr:uncharacterized protein EI97DRAFT_392719 [Westerdykella ornata]KAF2279645.1 hypothetical protein EI97DRAFT_392719 [Westerdykella ornata]
MVINYSKWDALELSDDSDIEVHPNVDKKSFIRAKQAQIHQQREQRRHQIKTLKYERIINDGLTLRLDRLITALKSHKADEGANPDAVVFQSMMESAVGDGGEDRPPTPPEGVHTQVKEKPSYPQMLASLIDEVKKDVDAKPDASENRLEKFISGLEGHKARVEDLQRQLLEKLAELEKEEKRHITSDDIHEGFNYSSVRKDPTPSSSKPATSAKGKETTVELLNPSRPDASASGAEADVDEAGSTLKSGEVDDDSVEASPLAKQFARIKSTDYHSLLEFIIQYPSILAEKETDGLLVEAFNSELDGRQKHAKACVHAALLIQYCRQLAGAQGAGPQGVQLFFKRITTKDHQANKLFHDDVESTYRRIHTRAAEIAKERAERPEAAEGVEQIQLHAVDPNTTINIVVPPKVSQAENPEEKAAEEAARAIFDSFPPGLQRALESGKLDEVNKVLAKMSVEEAEDIVEKLGSGGMLSLEQGVIDATTEEGKKAVEEIEKTHRMPGAGPSE